MGNFYLKVFFVACAASFLAAPVLKHHCALFRRFALGKTLALNGCLVAAIFGAGQLPLALAWPQQCLLAIFLLELAATASYYCAVAVRAVFFARQPQQVDLQRRRFLQQLFLAPLAGLIFYGGFYEAEKIVARRYRLLHQNAALGTVRLAQLSDVHLGRYFSLARFQALLEQLSSLDADLLAVTGDIFDNDAINAQAVEILASYCQRFPQGIYFCWGNHEYRHNQPYLAQLLAATPIHVLVNEHQKIAMPQGSFYLAGVDYPLDKAHQQEQCAKYTKQALAGIPEQQTTVLLAHHPDFLDNGFAARAFLTLAGHTHGGQFCLAGRPLFPFFKYMLGLFTQDGCYGYVNVGAGSWFPYRLGCPPEITLFEIENQKRGGETQKFA